jgi:hypothetical protein
MQGYFSSFPGSLGQLVFQSVEFFGQLMEPVKFGADHLHLVTMHRPKHLDHHGHGLLKLIEHLLLHEAELIDQRHQYRFGQAGLCQLDGEAGV